MRKFKSVLFVLFGVAVFGLFGLGTFGVEAADKKSTEEEENITIPEHISIGGTDVSGMSREDAEKIVQDYVEKYNDVELTFAVNDKSISADCKTVGLCAKNSDVVERALSYGKEGNIISRYKAQADMKNGKEKDFALSLTADIPTVEAYLNQHKGELVEEAVDNTVKLVDGEFEYVEGTPGETIMVGKSAVAIADFLATGWNGKATTIDLFTEKDIPRGTKEELSTIKDVLASYNTNFGTAVDGRTKNINVAADFLNGKIIYPGEVISVAETIGPTTAENGYFLAGAYENGATVEAYGGGVCQVATTLYNAVIRAELEVITRAAHSMVVTYVEPSMDAAIADGLKDFQFKNNQKTPIYIEAYTGGGNLYITIYGKETRDPNRTIEFFSEITSQTEPEKEFVAVGDQPIGYVETTTKPHIGYTARLWKVVYQNGVEVERKVFNNSKYSPSKEVISVGIATGSPEAQAAVLGAIESQNPDAIMATVATWTDAAIAERAAQAAAQAQSQKPADKPATEQERPDASTGGTSTGGNTVTQPQ